MDDTAEEEAVFGGDGVRALTSTTFRLSEDNDEEIAEAETTVVDTSSDRSEADDEEEENAVPLLLTRVSFAEGGDEDLDRGSTSTTFNAQEDEEEDITVERDVALDREGGDKESGWGVQVFSLPSLAARRPPS